MVRDVRELVVKYSQCELKVRLQILPEIRGLRNISNRVSKGGGGVVVVIFSWLVSKSVSYSGHVNVVTVIIL